MLLSHLACKRIFVHSTAIHTKKNLKASCWRDILQFKVSDVEDQRKIKWMHLIKLFLPVMKNIFLWFKFHLVSSKNFTLRTSNEKSHFNSVLYIISISMLIVKSFFDKEKWLFILLKTKHLHNDIHKKI